MKVKVFIALVDPSLRTKWYLTVPALLTVKVPVIVMVVGHTPLKTEGLAVMETALTAK